MCSTLLQESSMNQFRHEDKFVCSEEEVQLLRSRLSSHGIISERQNYQVASLYYDSRNQESFYSKQDGENLKTKLRMRFYDNNFSHFEIKEKQGSKNRKKKLNLKTDSDMNILNQEEVRFLFSGPVTPSIWVRYQREAFELKTREESIRITIDSSMTFKKPTSSFYEKSLPSVFIVEFKYIKHFDFLEDIYSSLMQKKPTSFSKFIEGVKCFYL